MLARGINGRNGQALVEFALIVPLLLLFLYAIIQFGLIMYGFINVEQAARIGVREASLGMSVTTVGTAIDRQVSGVGLNASATTTRYTPPSPFSSTRYRLVWDVYSAPASNATGVPATVVVTVDYQYPVLIPIIGQKNIQIQQILTMPQEDAPNGHIGSATSTNPIMTEGPTPGPAPAPKKCKGDDHC